MTPQDPRLGLSSSSRCQEAPGTKGKLQVSQVHPRAYKCTTLQALDAGKHKRLRRRSLIQNASHCYEIICTLWDTGPAFCNTRHFPGSCLQPPLLPGLVVPHRVVGALATWKILSMPGVQLVGRQAFRTLVLVQYMGEAEVIGYKKGHLTIVLSSSGGNERLSQARIGSR